MGLRRYTVPLPCALALAACGGSDGGGEGGEGGGDTWIEHRGGTVCSGDDAEPVAGSDVYVSPAGSDDAAGTSPGEAFATLARALCGVRAGQTVHVAEGEYHESVILDRFGDPDTPITISGEVGDGGALPVVDCDRDRSYGLALVGETASDRAGSFVVENLEIRGCRDAGIGVWLADGVTLRNLILRENGFHGVNSENGGEGFGLDLVEVNGLVVDGVEGVKNGPEPSVYETGLLGNDIAVWGSTDVMVTDCYTHDGIGGGLLFEDSVNAVAENNRFEDAELMAPHEELDGAVWIDGGHDVTLRGNVIAGNHGPGVQISDEGVQMPYGYLVEKNTIRDNDVGIFVWNFGVCPWPDASILTVRYNAFENNARGDDACEEWSCGVGQPCD